MDKRESESPWVLSLAVLAGYIPLGMVFGFLFVQSGAHLWQAIFMSIFVFAGALQFLSIGLLAAGANYAEIAMASLVMNLRHVFYGLSVMDIFPQSFAKRIYAIFALTDETYSLLTALPKEIARENAFKLSLLHHSYWVIGSAIGAFLGAVSVVQLEGLDFVLTALFVVLAVEQYRKYASVNAVFLSIICYIFASQIAPQASLFLALFFAAIVIFVQKYFWARKNVS